MKGLVRFIIAIGLLSVIGIVLLEVLIMPMYVRYDRVMYVPDVRGKRLNNAMEGIESEGFRSTVQDTVFTNKFRIGTVVDQFPAPDSRVKPGRTIRLKISQPEKLVLVPNLIGQSRRSAELALRQVSLLVDTIYTEFNPDYPKGTIAWQFPKGGDQLKKELGVQITVSKGLPPDFFQVPQLFGLSLENARKILIENRLKVGKISYQQNEDLIPYTILDQSIQAGTITDRSVDVDLVVSVLDMQDIFNQLTNE